MQMPVPKYDNYGRMLGFEMLDLIVEVPQIMYDGPYAECIHPKCFVPHPHYRDIQKMPAVFVVYRRSVDYLKQMAPEIYEAEQRRIQARFDEAIALTEQAFEAELASLVQSIQEQVTPQTVAEWTYEGPVQLQLAQTIQQLEAERDARQVDIDAAGGEITEPVAGMMRQQRQTLDALAIAQDQQNLVGASEIEVKGAKLSWRPSGGGRKIKQLFDAPELAEQWLTARGCVKTGERQERRNMRADSMERLNEFLTRFQNLSVRSNDQLDALVEQARAAAEHVSPEAVNNEGEGAAQLRESLREAMAQIRASLDTMTVGDGRRHIDFSEEV
jgi:hypothetical protein